MSLVVAPQHRQPADELRRKRGRGDHALRIDDVRVPSTRSTSFISEAGLKTTSRTVGLAGHQLDVRELDGTVAGKSHSDTVSAPRRQPEDSESSLGIRDRSLLTQRERSVLDDDGGTRQSMPEPIRHLPFDVGGGSAQ
jgi:hypothetical protein